MPPSCPGEGRFPDILHRLGEEPPGRALLTEIVDAILRALDAERVFLFRFREAGGFRVLVGRNFEGDDIRFPQQRMSHYAVGKMEKSGSFLAVPEPRQDRRYRSEDVLAGRKLPRSILIFPLRAKGDVTGGVYADHRFHALSESLCRDESVQAWVALCELAVTVREQRTRIRWLERRLDTARRKVRRLDDGPTVAEHSRKKSGTARPERLEEFYGMFSANPDVLDLFDDLRRMASSSIPVLLVGETGVGKSLLARSVHQSSPRAGRPFVVLSCGALTDTLMESELFGHVKGAFTGADVDRTGIFVQAHGGTLCLDEVADMSPEMQTKFLRVLQDGKVRPVGAKDAIEVDCRIISTTSHNLEKLVREGKFRRDLYFRLKSAILDIPPLRERWEDIPGLAEHFLARYTRHDQVPRFHPSVLDLLVDYSWPGNVRELENEVRRLAALGYEEVTVDSLLSPLRERESGGSPLASIGPGTRHLEEVVSMAEREAILAALRSCRGNKSKAAGELGITRKALYRRLAKYGMSDRAREDGRDREE